MPRGERDFTPHTFEDFFGSKPDRIHSVSSHSLQELNSSMTSYRAEIERRVRINCDNRPQSAISVSSIEGDLPRFYDMYGISGLEANLQKEKPPASASITGQMLHIEDAMYTALRQGTVGSGRVTRGIEEAFPTTPHFQLRALRHATHELSAEMQDGPSMLTTFLKARRKLYAYPELFGPKNFVLPDVGDESMDPVEWAQIIYSERFQKKGRTLAYAFAWDAAQLSNEWMYRDDLLTLREVPMTVKIPQLKLVVSGRLDSLTVFVKDGIPHVEVVDFKSSPFIPDPEIEMRQAQTSLFLAEQIAINYLDELVGDGVFERGKKPFALCYDPDKRRVESYYSQRHFDERAKRITSRRYSFRYEGGKSRQDYFEWLKWYSHSKYLENVTTALNKIATISGT